MNNVVLRDTSRSARNENQAGPVIVSWNRKEQLVESPKASEDREIQLRTAKIKPMLETSKVCGIDEIQRGVTLISYDHEIGEIPENQAIINN